MLKATFFVLLVATVSLVQCQDLDQILEQAGGDSVFNGIMQELANQWGSLTADDVHQFLQSFQKPALHQLWTNLSDHCSSNIQCGPDACCMKPTITGKRALIERAIIDGTHVHFGSYCAKLRDVGEACSDYNTNQHFYNFHCPCKQNSKCVHKGTVSLHPLIQVQTQGYCQ